MDFAKIEQLVDLVARSSIAELDLTQDGTRIRILKRPAAEAPPAPARPAGGSDPQTPSANHAPGGPADIVVSAPMHGVFYRSAAPDEPPLVEVGARIEAGQKICTIEAMKAFIDIAAETSGVVLAIFAENGDEIAAGQALFRIGPAGSS
ncbi:acetyl-CoA carboxylase biotin carboxyl carrier protein subunit [Bradyrhizobium diazoefficiens]|uniref:acetyl-CoA carboxylase biotin carboxyl carrier protein n=1 Tax=Bradyrhizobium diazoefficiens TaxID=1355477 RepID=UPI00190B5962|nr:acetyl-CoA carboxylase biotin carboxyl carrier protein subunit [Bradyrhizobium diazoefficiens]MBK3665561.1 acetyl-CoA carboxylase biotin carboxyl carrier protein subunit [Bradyrhizobium diazoefficiens]